MPKCMQKIVLFIELNDDPFFTPEKIGNLFINRFVIEEDASFEIIKILELGKTSWKMSWSSHSEYANFENERNQKGMDRLFLIITE